jgi:hypothetical protein
MKIIDITNRFVKSKKLSGIEKELVIEINNYLKKTSFILEQNQMEATELAYNYIKLRKSLEYKNLLLNCSYYIDFFEIDNFKEGFFNNNFMIFFLKNTDKLKRRIDIEMFTRLNQGFILNEISNKKISNLNDCLI